MMLFNNCGRIIILFISFFYTSFLSAEQSIGRLLELSSNQLQQYEQKKFKVLGAIQVESSVDNYQLMEFSGIAWDNDENKMVILSDRGFIIHVKPIFQQDKLVDTQFISHHHLKDASGKKLNGKAADSEGLALINSNNKIKGDTELIISFERQPRISQYKSDGNYISDRPIKNILNNKSNYSGANKALEAITFHNQHGLITGPERPLNGTSEDHLSLHSLENKSWNFIPENNNYGSLVGLTTLPDNSLIALERIFPGIFAGVTSVIHQIKIENDSLKQSTLLKLEPADGFLNDNFEGITWHKDNRFFIISDDNDNFLQRTLLVYFEIPGLDN